MNLPPAQGRWTHNPQYALTLSAPATIDISLERPSAKWAPIVKRHTLAALMGLYVIKGEAAGTPMRSPSAVMAGLIHETNFLPGHEVKASLYLEPLPDGAPYILMPATFGEGMRGPFSLGVTADGAPVEISLLESDGLTLRDAKTS